MAASTSSALALLALLWAASRMLAAPPDAHEAFVLPRPLPQGTLFAPRGVAPLPVVASLAAVFPELVRIDAGRIEALAFHPDTRELDRLLLAPLPLPTPDVARALAVGALDATDASPRVVAVLSQDARVVLLQHDLAPIWTVDAPPVFPRAAESSAIAVLPAGIAAAAATAAGAASLALFAPSDGSLLWHSTAGLGAPAPAAHPPATCRTVVRTAPFRWERDEHSKLLFLEPAAAAFSEPAIVFWSAAGLSAWSANSGRLLCHDAHTPGLVGTNAPRKPFGGHFLTDATGAGVVARVLTRPMPAPNHCATSVHVLEETTAEVAEDIALCSMHSEHQRRSSKRIKMQRLGNDIPVESVATTLTLPMRGEPSAQNSRFIALMSDGEVLQAHMYNGESDWSYKTSSGWDHALLLQYRQEQAGLAAHANHSMASMLSQAFWPSIDTVFVDPQLPVLVAVGWDSLSLLTVEGDLLSQVTLPSFPVAPLVFGDFSGDGVPDIIVPCNTGLVGIQIHIAHGSPLFELLLAASALLVILQRLWDVVASVSFGTQGEHSSRKPRRAKARADQNCS